MKIIIEYNSSWDGILLDGLNDELNFNKNRKQLKKGTKDESIPISHSINKNTIMGILYRLVGEQRKLWMVRKSNDYLGFLYNKIDWTVKDEIVSRELVALRDIHNTDHPNSFAGISRNESNILFKEQKYYSYFLFPLTCSIKELYDLIVSKKFKQNLNFEIKGRLDLLSFLEPKSPYHQDISLLNNNEINKMMSSLQTEFSNVNYKVTDLNKIDIYRLSALYMVSEFLYANNKGLRDLGEDIKNNKKNHWHKGISHRIFTFKDFVGSQSAKGYVISYPMDDSFRDKKERLKKKDGILEIKIELPFDQANNLKICIEKAGISVFNIGKKGTAYIKKITI